MIFTVYDKKTRAIVSRTRFSRPPPPELFERNGQVGVEGEHPETWLGMDNKPASLAPITPKVSSNVVEQLPEGAEVRDARDDSLIAKAPASGRVALAVTWDQTVAIAIRHPRYRPTNASVPCSALKKEQGAAKVNQDGDQMRREEYEKAGLGMDRLVVALIEGDPIELSVIATKRAAVKLKIPK